MRSAALPKAVMFLLIQAIVFSVGGCGGGEKDFDPKAGPTSEQQQATKTMEDFMKTQGKTAPKK